jgi:hypothetical protein
MAFGGMARSLPQFLQGRFDPVNGGGLSGLNGLQFPERLRIALSNRDAAFREGLMRSHQSIHPSFNSRRQPFARPPECDANRDHNSHGKSEFVNPLEERGFGHAADALCQVTAADWPIAVREET